MSEGEKLLKTVYARWKVVFRDGKLRGEPYSFFWGELRTPVLTSKRIILYKEETADSEILISDIKKAKDSLAGGFLSWLPYLWIMLKDGRNVSLVFLHILSKKYSDEEKKSFDDYATAGGYTSAWFQDILFEWVQAINRCVKI
jgi:hypothetical protein